MSPHFGQIQRIMRRWVPIGVDTESANSLGIGFNFVDRH